MLINVNITICGYAVTTEIKIEESEIKGMTEEEKNEYIQQEAYEYVKENLEVSCEEIE